MQPRLVSLSFCLALALSTARRAEAIDTITLDGEEKPVAGEIVGVSKTDITIKTGLKKVEQKVPANTVARVRFDKEPPGLLLARNAETAGRYQDALEKFQEALEENPPDLLKAELQFLIARTTARMAMADAAKLDEAQKLLTNFIAAHADNFRFYPAVAQLGDVYLAKDDFANAASTFAQLEAAPWTDYKMSAGTSQARLLLKQNKVGEARAAFDAVVGMDAQTPAEKTRRYEAMLGKAVCLQREGQHEEAVKSLTEISEQAAAGATRLQAEAHVRQGDSLRQMEGRTKDAILAYLHVDVLFPKESAQHAESLFWLSKLWTAVGHPDRASAAASKLETSYPKSEWTAKLASG